MRKIIYYVATSLDGFIAGKNNDISMFAMDGEGVDQYTYDLQSFDTVIMGRNTYEFGYQYGLKAGEPAYPNMEHFIFSNSISFKNADDKVKVIPLDLTHVINLKNQVGSDIYLCGGGMFAGWLMENKMIDEIKLKINPIILGEGVRLFGDYTAPQKLDLMYNQSFEDGFQITTYNVINN